MNMKIPSDRLIHIGIVVRDAKASAKKFSQIYGITDWQVVDHAGDRLTETTTHGKRAEHAFITASGVAPTPEGEVTFRLIQPTGGWTTYHEFLNTRGEGIHNLCISAVSRGQLDQLVAWLQTEDVPVGQTTWLDGKFGYVCLDTRKALGGFYVQLLVGDSADAAPEPDERWSFPEVAGQGLLPLGTSGMHYGVVVRDVMAAAERWTRLFGLGKIDFYNWRKAPGSLEDPQYLGQPVDHAYFATMFQLAPLLGFEVIQSTFGPTHYKEDYLNVVGEGIHHINATFLPDADHWQAAEKRMGDFGCPVVMGGGIGNGFIEFRYLDTRQALGYVTEISYPGANFAKGPGDLKAAMSADFSA